MRVVRSRLGWPALLGLTMYSAVAVAQELSASEIVTLMMERNTQRQSILQRYLSERSYKLEYHGPAGDHHAEMLVRAEYTAPGRKRLTVVSESGSKVLCREVLRRLVEAEQETAAKQDWQRSMFSPESYNLQLLGTETFDGMRSWVIAVDPKQTTSKVGYRGKIWVSMDDYATVRVQAEPTKSLSWMLEKPSFDAVYRRRGEVWVPATNVSITHVRLGGEAKVTIDYGEYSVLATVPAEGAGAVAHSGAVPSGVGVHAHSLR